jgi:hypothetical protein
MTQRVPASMADSDVGRIVQVVNTLTGAVAPVRATAPLRS